MVTIFLRLSWLLIAGGISLTNGRHEKQSTYTVYINFEEYSVRANVMHDANKVKAKMGHMYYWYVNNDIKKTDGSFDGKLLHGEYKSFFRNMNLKEEGNFKYGLKEGQWKTWYEDGKIRELVNYNKGQEDGMQELYDEQGRLISKTNFKHGVKDGKMILYKKNKSDSIVNYKNGEQQIPKPSKSKKTPGKESQNDPAKNEVKRVNKAKDTIAQPPKSSFSIKKIFNKSKKTGTEPSIEKKKSDRKEKAPPKNPPRQKKNDNPEKKS